MPAFMSFLFTMQHVKTTSI